MTLITAVTLPATRHTPLKETDDGFNVIKSVPARDTLCAETNSMLRDLKFLTLPHKYELIVNIVYCYSLAIFL